MKHEELLELIENQSYLEASWEALQAVVKLHKPSIERWHEGGCEGCSWDRTYVDWQEEWPCATIKAIQAYFS